MSAHNSDGMLICLPPEILLNIFARLSKKHLKSIRLTSKYFGQVGSELLIDEIVIAANYKSLQAVKEITKRPVFRNHLKRIKFDMSTLNYCSMSAAAVQGLLWSNLAAEQDRSESQDENVEGISVAEVAFGWMHAAESLSRTGTTGEIMDPSVTPTISKGIMKEQAMHHKLYQDQETIRGKGLDLIAFEEALDCLPNIKAVTLTNRTSRDYLASDEEYLGDDKEQLDDNICHGLLAGSVNRSYIPPEIRFQARVLRSISHFNKTVTSFRTSFGNSDWLCTACLDMPELDLQLLCGAFANLRELRLSFCRYRVEHEDLQPLRTGNLARLLQAARHLEHLRLDLDGFSPNGFNKEPVLSNLFLGVERWPNLQSIRLVGVPIHLSELSALIDRQLHTLTEVALVGCHLWNGHWYEALEMLRHLTDLKEITLGRLTGNGISGRVSNSQRKISYSDLELYVLEGGTNPLSSVCPRMQSGYHACEACRLNKRRRDINQKFEH